MLARFGQTHRRKASAAFTLAELVIALAIFVMVTSGLIYGYTQSNEFAEWNAMSLSAQAYAAQGVEQALAAQWNNSLDQLPPTTNSETGVMQVPISGQTFSNTITINITSISTNPPLRQIRADCVWKFPRTGTWFTNTVITQRACDQ